MGSSRANGPNVVLIVVDCLRNDHFLGEGNARIPFLERLRKKGTVFTQAISTASSTSPCLASILTGRYSFKHGIRNNGPHTLDKGVKTIAEAFREKGYYTIAEVTGPLGEGLGLDRGFDEYNFRDIRKHTYGRWGEELIGRIKEKGLKEPFFLLVHLWELHRMRFMAREFNKARYGKIAYERALSCLDSYLEKLLGCFDENTVVVLTADHGEKIPANKMQEYFNHLCFAFYAVLRVMGISKGYCRRESHGFDLSEELLRIPLLLKGEAFQKGGVIEQQVGQVDIAATLAELFGLNLGKGIDGRSLLPLVKGKKLQEWPVFVEATDLKIPRKGDWLEGVRTGRWKYVHAAQNPSIPEQLFDLKYDAKQSRNLAAERQDVLGAMREKLQALKGKRF